MSQIGRKSIRIPNFDYSAAGAYFVTVCVDKRQSRLGSITAGQMIANTFGLIAHRAWTWLQQQFPLIRVDIYCIMPNHVHALLMLAEAPGDLNSRRGALQSAPTPTSQEAYPKPLGRLIGAYKTHTTIEINRVPHTPSARFWQRNYYEHVIRNEIDYESVWNYIESNPQNWASDEENDLS
jgi:REP element-mobilizing transposase RayT